MRQRVSWRSGYPGLRTEVSSPDSSYLGTMVQYNCPTLTEKFRCIVWPGLMIRISSLVQERKEVLGHCSGEGERRKVRNVGEERRGSRW